MMIDNPLRDPLSYRQEILAPLFKLVQSSESCVLVGVASMGKSRLVQHMLQPAVQQHYPADNAQKILFVWVDCNRLAAITEWGLYELLLTALTEAIDSHALANLRQDLNQLRKEALLAGNALLAQRHVELAMRMLVQERRLQLCLLLDEFDEAYQTLPRQTLANLRALRDANKYRLSYILLMRDHPAQLRPPQECEGFYELCSRSIMGLKPHTLEDTQALLRGIALRRGHESGNITDEAVAQICQFSGGHPGLAVALLNALIQTPPIGLSWLEWGQGCPEPTEECRKIWEGLRNEEQHALHHLTNGLTPGFRERDSLILKGLIHISQSQQFNFFSPLFYHFVMRQAPASKYQLHIDKQAGTVWVNGQRTKTLTDKEFKLLAYFYEHQNDIREVSQVIAALYPGSEAFNINDNAISALVKRVRDKIEPDAKHPQFLLNVKGRGYRLLVGSGEADLVKTRENCTL